MAPPIQPPLCLCYTFFVQLYTYFVPISHNNESYSMSHLWPVLLPVLYLNQLEWDWLSARLHNNYHTITTPPPPGIHPSSLQTRMDMLTYNGERGNLNGSECHIMTSSWMSHFFLGVGDIHKKTRKHISRNTNLENLTFKLGTHSPWL